MLTALMTACAVLGVVNASVLPRGAHTVTVTKTVTATTTVTATPSCPTGPTSCPEDAYISTTLNFDDISCPSICTFPSLQYHNFTFDGSAGWLIVNSASAVDSRAVSSLPNGLLTMSSGLVGLGSKGQGFVFDVLRFQWSVFSNDDDTNVIFFMNSLQGNGNTRNYTTRVQSGIDIAPYMIDLSGPNGSLTLDFSNLVHLEFAAYTSWDPATKTGMPATIIFDDFTLRKHADPCNV
ncbi:hypothetical protein EXIGLDRAFT_726562 [Exidia glandulosa HHB12029]|uniref:Concanavalin A-like lectin/glucanase n=1 Tax=Exidia glandulosa HHB12029 TaxID=1314781 RepID=A0A165DP41_EXIGL|nr:hypothetical protein EXIGLDRAFT_726562 [Exidia glandulosa HHB12029]